MKKKIIILINIIIILLSITTLILLLIKNYNLWLNEYNAQIKEIGFYKVDIKILNQEIAIAGVVTGITISVISFIMGTVGLVIQFLD